MPQQSLLPSVPPMTSLRIEVNDGSASLFDSTEVVIKVAEGHGIETTVFHATLVGVMTDFLDTMVQTATQTWAYGTDRAAVARAVGEVYIAARRHRETHNKV